MPRRKTSSPPPYPFRWFDSSPEVIRLVVMMYVECPLSLRNVEDLLHELGIDVCDETMRLWSRRFGPMFARDPQIAVEVMAQHIHLRWRLDEFNVKINGEMQYLWRAVGHKGEVLNPLALRSETKTRR